MSNSSLCPGVHIIIVSNSSLCPNPHCFIVFNLSLCPSVQKIFVSNSSLCQLVIVSWCTHNHCVQLFTVSNSSFHPYCRRVQLVFVSTVQVVSGFNLPNAILCKLPCHFLHLLLYSTRHCVSLVIVSNLSLS